MVNQEGRGGKGIRTQVVLRQAIVALDVVTDIWTATSILDAFHARKAESGAMACMHKQLDHKPRRTV